MIQIGKNICLVFFFLIGFLPVNTTGQGLGANPIENRDSLMGLLPGSSGRDRVNLLNEISYSLFYSDRDSSLLFAQKAMALADSTEYVEGRVNALLLIGSIYRLREDFDEAYIWLKKAESSMDSTTHWFTYLRVWNTIANTCHDFGLVDAALIRYQAVVDRFSKEQKWWPVVSALNTMSVIHSNERDYDKQINCLEELRTIILERYCYPDTELLSYNAVTLALEPARFYSLHGRYPEALKSIDTVNVSLKKLKISAVEEAYFKAKIAGQKARVYSQWGKYRTSLAWYDTSILIFESSMEYFGNEISQKRKKCSRADFEMNLANQLEGKAIVQMHLGDFSGASENFHISAKKREAINDLLGVAMCYDGLGEINLLKGRFGPAVALFDSAMLLKLDYKRFISDKYPPATAQKNFKTIDESLAITCMKKGDLYRDWDKQEIALEQYEKAQEYSIGIGNIKGEAEALNSMGGVYLKQGLNEKAFGYFNRSLKLYREMDIRPGIARVLKNIGDYHKLQRHLPEAAGYYDSTELIALDIMLMPLLAETYLEKAGIHYLQGDLTSSMDFYEKSLNISRKAGLVKQEMLSHAELAALYEKRNRFDKAFEHFREYNLLKDSLFTLDATKQIAKAEAEYETGIREQQIQLMENENELRRADLRQTRFWIFALGFSFVFSTLLVSLFIRQNRLKILQDRMIMEQKLLRTQMNPHFIFNALANIQSFMFANDPRKAGGYLSKLSRLLRNVLEGSKDDFVLLVKETETLESYLELQKMRFSEEFNWTITVDENIDPELVKIPPMLWQPFIENSVEYGTRKNGKLKKITISFSKTEHCMECIVEDNRVFSDHVTDPGNIVRDLSGTAAVSITAERLTGLRKKYKQDFRLIETVLRGEQGEPAGTRVEFSFPYI